MFAGATAANEQYPDGVNRPFKKLCPERTNSYRMPTRISECVVCGSCLYTTGTPPAQCSITTTTSTTPAGRILGLKHDSAYWLLPLDGPRCERVTIRITRRIMAGNYEAGQHHFAFSNILSRHELPYGHDNFYERKTTRLHPVAWSKTLYSSAERDGTAALPRLTPAASF